MSCLVDTVCVEGFVDRKMHVLKVFCLITDIHDTLCSPVLFVMLLVCFPRLKLIERTDLKQNPIARHIVIVV